MNLRLRLVEDLVEDFQISWTAFDEKEGKRTGSEISTWHLNYLASSDLLSGGLKAVSRNERQDFPPRAAFAGSNASDPFPEVLKIYSIPSFQNESYFSLLFSFFFLTVPAEVYRDLRPGVLLCHSRGINIFCRGHHGRGRGWALRKKLSK